MAPIESQITMQPGNMMQNTISLSVLMEHVIQKTYSDLTILSQTLSTKTDLEKKVAIYQFANRTKQLFVRLLALVKWINSANKVEKCARITSFLQQQQMIFVETADALYRMAKETLVRARLPCFSLPAAVDVLTTGTYPRLPHCIKEKIVPPESLPTVEKKKVLSKLTQVIEYRIVTSDLPACMCKPILDNGRVKFLVDHEFEVTLTLMGDAPNLPWRLLKIDILVEDHENGSSSFLVHPKQVEFLREVVQMRLLEGEQPLHDLYNCLHYFCQSLQLEVLNYQVIMLIRERFGEHMKVEEYLSGRSLSISYWRLSDHNKPKSKPYHQGFKLSIHVDDKKFGKPLQITHFPQIMGVDGVKCLKQINVACLSIEKVWTHTIQIRSTIKLKELKRELEMFMQLKCEMTGVPPMISIQLVPPLKETIVISVDDLKGIFIVNLPSSVSSFKTSLADCLNSDKKDLRHIIFDIKQNVVMSNYKRMIRSSTMTLLDHPIGCPFSDTKNVHVVRLNNITKTKLIIKYEKDGIRFYLHSDGKSKDEKDLREINPEVIEKWIAINWKNGMSLNAVKFSPGGNLYSGQVSDFGDLSKELMFVYRYAEDILCFTELSEELLRHGISNTRYLPDPTGIGLVLTLLSFPSIEGISANTKRWLKKIILSVTFTLLRKERIAWLVEITFQSSLIKGKEGVQNLTFNYEITGLKNTVAAFIDDWSKICHLYEAVLPFSRIYNNSSLKQATIPTVDVISYSLNKIAISYGPSGIFCADIVYSPKFKSLQLALSTTAPSVVSNCHSITYNYLEHVLNEEKSLYKLCRVFEDTCDMLTHVSKLNTSPVTWLKKNYPVQSFTIIPLSPYHIKIFSQSLFCIEVCSGPQRLTIRDGFHPKNNDILAPIPCFPTFLDGFTAELRSMKVHVGREGDSQSSPMPVEQMDFISPNMNFMSHNSPLSHKLTASSPAQMMLHSNNNSPSTMFTQSPGNQTTSSSKRSASDASQVLAVEAFGKLISQTPGAPGSPLDRFLGAIFFRRHLQAVFAASDSFTLLTTSDPTCLAVKCEMLNLNLKFSISSRLHLKILPVQDQMVPWQVDDLPTIEKYFESKVAIFPFKPARLEAFCVLLKIQYHILKDFVQVLKLEMNPDKNLNWNVQLLLTLPHSTGLEHGIGSCALLLITRKIMFVLRFSKNIAHSAGSDVTPSPPIVAAFFYDTITNYIQLVECQKNANTNLSSLVKRFTEYSIKTNECCLFSLILELMNNLQLLN